MSKYIIAVILACFVSSIIQAQRMLPGGKAVEISAGTLIAKNLDHDYFLNAGLNVNAKSGNYFLWALEYSRMRTSYKDMKIPVETYLTEAGYSLYLFGDRKKCFSLNAGVMALIGYESVNRGEAVLFDGAEILNKGGFVYGGAGRLSAEAYISDRLVLVAQGRARVFWNTSVNRFRPSIGLGIRFNF